MPFVLLTVVLIVIGIVWLFIRDSRTAAQNEGPADQPVATRRAPSTPRKSSPAQPSPVDSEKLAGHVTGLRQAVQDGLIGRDEAIASLIRQANGNLSEQAAARLLDDEAAS